jgi:STE24 endopeptidase
VIFLLQSLFQLILDHINISHVRQQRNNIPRVFQGTVDKKKRAKISDYTVDSTKFGIVATLFDKALLLTILLSGFLPSLTEIVQQWSSRFFVRGMTFFTILALIFNVFHVPLDLYSTFVIEERYGFNTRTLKVWSLDWLKSSAISVVLGAILLWSLLALIYYLKDIWWFWAGLIVAAFELLMLWLYPVIIAPIFNKFEPIANKALEYRIKTLMMRAGFQVRGVFQMDAGKRSKHTNAYFTGIGRVKQIVLFDTLFESHPDEEIVSIVAHEVGHWKKRHLLKNFILILAISFIGFWVLSKLMNWHLLYNSFGVKEHVVYVGLFLSGVLISPIVFFSRPLQSAISRKFEREADEVAYRLMGTAIPICNALIRLTIDNLINLSPHPLYAWFYYSHPPPAERIARLERMEEGLR